METETRDAIETDNKKQAGTTDPASDFTEALVLPGDVGVRWGFFDSRVQAHCGPSNAATPVGKVPPKITEESLLQAWDWDAWDNYIARFEFHGTNPMIRLYPLWQPPHVPVLIVDSSAIDSRLYRRAQDPGWFNGFEALRLAPLPTHSPTVGTARWVRAIVRWVLCHEGDELLRVDGARRFNPHASKSYGAFIENTDHWRSIEP